MYTISRSFDLYKSFNFRLVLSNDGSTLIYLTDYVFTKDEASRHVTVYKKGKLAKSYSLTEFTGCDPDIEKCSLLYNNYEQVVDKKKSNYGTASYQKIFKDSVSEEEKFLNENYVLVNNDTVYSTDSRKIVTVYDLKNPQIIERVPFAEIYPAIKNCRSLKSEIDYFDFPYKRIEDLENKKTHQPLSAAIGELLGLKFVSINEKDYFRYKLYRIDMSGYLYHNGKFEMETFKCDENLNAQRIKDYITHHHFSSGFIPKQIEKQYFNNFYGGYRNLNDSIAELETILDKQNKEKEFQRRLTLDSIEGVYIPKDLQDCFAQLDKILKPVDKKAIRNFKDHMETYSLHMSLGMWIRNNWGLWGGSRLLKYFTDRGVTHPDSMSSVILWYYYDWLKGDKNAGTDWEKRLRTKK